MSTTRSFAWGSGGGNITVTYDGTGNGTITITSNKNTVASERSKTLAIRTLNGSVVKTLTINQAAAPPVIDLTGAIITIPVQTYSGSALTPTPTLVTLEDGTTVVPSEGYTITGYTNNTNAGTGTITIEGTGDYVGTVTGEFTIQKADPVYVIPVANNHTYTGSSDYLISAGSTSDGTIQYSSDNSTWSTTRPEETDANTYTVYWRLTGDSNHNSVSSTSITVTIAKANPTYTSPTAKTLTYSGSSQTLLNAGSSSHGTIQYSGDGNTWSATIPSETNSDTYTVYWKLVGDSNHNDISSTSISVTIAKANPTYTAPSAKTGLVYSGSAQSLLNAGSSSDGTLYYIATTEDTKPSSTSGFSSSIPEETGAGSYYLWYYVVGDSNHNDSSINSSSISVSIAKADINPSVTLSGWTYGDTGNTPSVSGNSGNGTVTYTYKVQGSSDSTYSSSKPSSVGNYTVKATIAETDNYNSGSCTANFAISKASGSVSSAPTAKTGLVYNGSAQSVANAGSGTGTMYYRIGTSGNFSTSIPEVTNAGSYTLYYYAAESDSYTQSSTGNISVSIAKANPTYTAPIASSSLVYTGNAQYLTTTGSTSHGTIQYSEDGSTWSTTRITGTNANTYTTYWKLTGDSNHNDVSSSSISTTISQASGVAGITTVPGLAYNRGPQNLVSVSGNTGTVHYRIGTSGEFSTTIPSSTNAGSYTIYYYVDASSDGNYASVGSSSSPSSISSSIAKVTPTVDISPAKVSDFTYDGNAHDLLTGGYVVHSELVYVPVEGTFTYAQGTNAGTYSSLTWSFAPTDTTNYNSTSGTVSGSVIISKADPTYTAPTAKTGLVYTGSAQYLLNAGSTDEGTIEYSSDGSTWSSTTIPQQTNANTTGYTVYWKLTGNSNYNSVSSTSITVTIAKAQAEVTSLPTGNSNLIYNGSSQGLLVSSSASTNTGAIQFRSKLSSDSSYGSWGGYPKATNAGTYNVQCRAVGDENNYIWSEPSEAVNVTIAQKALTITAKAQTITYGGSIATGTNQVTTSGLVSSDSLTGITLTASTANVTTSGTITPSSATTTKGIGNYNVTYQTGTLTINKANPTYTAPSAKTLTYSGSSQELVNAGSSSHGTFTYSTSQNGTYSATIPQGTNASNYTVYWKFTGDSNHNSVGATQVTGVSIAKKALSITAKAQTITYGGSIATGTGQVTTSGLVSGDSLTAITLTASTTNVPGGTITPSAASTTKGASNYTITYNTGTLTINKANPTYTAPTANTLTYSGSAQYLTTTGSTSHGTIYYSSDGTNWYTTRRTGTNAGDYTTYWKLTGDSNHSDIASTSISTTIAQATGQVTTAPTANTITYSGSAQYLVTAGSGTGTIYYSYRYKSYSASSWGSWSTASTTRPSRTNAGYYEVRYYAAASSDGNYSQSATGTVSSIEIQKATPTYTAPTKKTGLTYTGSAQALLNAGSTSHGTFYYSTNNSTWSTSIPTQTNVNTSGYTVYWKLTGDSNHNNVASTTISGITIAKASRTLSFPNPITVISPSSTFTNIAVPSAGAGDGTISYSSGTTSKATVNSSTGAVTGVAEGTSVITATISAGTNYNSASTTYTVTVQAAVKNYAYTGSVQNGSFPAAIYKLQVWGAQGGSNAADSSYGITAKAGGKGGYSVGILKLASASTLYAFVGGQGGASGNGGWNGGGGGSGSSSYNSGNDITKMGCGGGGTDIALTTSSMSYSSYRNNRTDASLKSRMIVAGGGGGGAMRCTKTSGSATTPVDLTSGATTEKYLSTTGVATNGDYYNIKRIQLSAGQRLTATVWVGAETCYFATTNSSGSSYTPISTANSYGSYTIDYTASSACYVAVCFLSNTGTVDNDYILSIYAQISSRSDITTSTIQNVEWSKVFLDNEDKIISGIRTDNTLYTGLSYNKGTSSANIISSSTTNTTSYKVGYVGGGTSGGGYSDTYKGRQTAAGTNGAFGKGANQTTTSYKYASACGGGGWYGGGGGRYNNSTSSYMQQSGGGSGFVNIAANASSRPSSYTGLQLDQGTTYDGATSFEATSGSTETGHAGDGYARITRVSPLDAVADIVYAKLDAGNVDYSEVTDAEWQHVLVDNDNKILAGIRQDGTMFVSDYIQNL